MVSRLCCVLCVAIGNWSLAVLKTLWYVRHINMNQNKIKPKIKSKQKVSGSMKHCVSRLETKHNVQCTMCDVRCRQMREVLGLGLGVSVTTEAVLPTAPVTSSVTRRCCSGTAWTTPLCPSTTAGLCARRCVGSGRKLSGKSIPVVATGLTRRREWTTSSTFLTSTFWPKGCDCKACVRPQRCIAHFEVYSKFI
jgi:hypothetical protein